jgi:hypothetical protein
MDPQEDRTEGAELRWSQHLVRAVDAFAREMHGAVPPEFARHARGSARECLLAIRSLIDAKIARIDAMESNQERRQVPVE